MGYDRVITSGEFVEVYRYANRPSSKRGVRKNESAVGVPHILQGGQDAGHDERKASIRTPQSARRAEVSFRRLVLANLIGKDYPIFASLTYRENMVDVGQARKDFKAFSRRCQGQWGQSFKYLSVFEYQERGAIHYHALLWGVPVSVVAEERRTRLVASLWGRGFVDLIATDGNPKIAWYLSKYMGKTFADVRLAGRKAYVASQNILRPVDDKDCVLGLYYSQESAVSLLDALLISEKEYSTQWLGRATYQQYQLQRYAANSAGEGGV